MKRPWWFIALLLLLTVARRGEAQVDQQNWEGQIAGGFLNPAYDTRQEFTPSLPSLDSIQLAVGQFGMPVSSLQAGVLQINIREGGAAGPILATSLPMAFPPFYSGTPIFLFAELACASSFMSLTFLCWITA